MLRVANFAAASVSQFPAVPPAMLISLKVVGWRVAALDWSLDEEVGAQKGKATALLVAIRRRSIEDCMMKVSSIEVLSGKGYAKAKGSI